MDLVVNTDGASRGNPGDASYGYVIQARGGAILHEEGGAIGIETNNVAEYTAVLKAFEYIKQRWGERKPLAVEVVADSELIVKQLRGEYKIKNQNLKKYFDRIKSFEFDLGRVSYRNVPRAQNFIADRLANQALDNQILKNK